MNLASDNYVRDVEVAGSNPVSPTNKHNDLGHSHRVAFFVVTAW